MVAVLRKAFSLTFRSYLATREMERKIIGTGLAYRTAVNINDQRATIVCNRLARAALSSAYVTTMGLQKHEHRHTRKSQVILRHPITQATP